MLGRCNYGDVSLLIGKVLTNIENIDGTELFFHTADESFRMHHIQDCCEAVYIEEIIGDLADLIGSPITMAEETSQEADREDINDYSGTWTFYKFATIKGYVTIRWIGQSNGYYSEAVDFEIL